MARVDTHPDPHIGAALRRLRNRAGLQQREVSERMEASGSGLSTVWLSQVENGRQRPSRRLVRELMDVYGADEVILEALLSQRPWETEGLRVTHGSEWEDEAQLHRYARTAAASDSSHADLARSLAELNELFIRITDDQRDELLRHARRLGQ